MKMKTLAILFMSICALYAGIPAFAATSSTWILCTDTGRQVDVSNVEYLVGTDSSELFSVVLKDNSLITDVKEVTFLSGSASGIHNTELYNGPIITYNASSLIITNLTGNNTDIHIYNMTGTLVNEAKSISGKATIDISSLTAGAYIVKVGSTSFKFLKN